MSTDPNLSIIGHSGSYAIVRLSPDNAKTGKLNNEILSTIGDQNSFFSVTQTIEEVSVVCNEESQFAREQNKNRDALNSEYPGKIECGWSLLQVKGQLEFEMVGVIAKFSSWFAEAGIPIFCISTFDTDYFLVKSSRLDDALHTLTKHEISWTLKHA